MSDDIKRELLPGEAEVDAWVDTLEQRADAMSDDCEHPNLHFQSGDFYLFCHDCGQTWATVNRDRNAIDPTRANRGKGSQLSSQLRSKAEG